LLNTYSAKGDTVLDPFLGTGTTTAAMGSDGCTHRKKNVALPQRTLYIIHQKNKTTLYFLHLCLKNKQAQSKKRGGI
jgi:hypothetical protein